jgi:hypothetical protein
VGSEVTDAADVATPGLDHEIADAHRALQAALPAAEAARAALPELEARFAAAQAAEAMAP